jgi:predicted GNAT family acetyltransferase
MKYTAPRKMNPMRLVEMQPEWWNLFEVGPYGFYRTDKPSGPVIMDWHRYTMMGARLFGLTHKGQVHSFMAVAFRKKEPVAHIYLAYVPIRSRGKGYAKELKRQFFELAKAEGIQTVTVDCMTPEGVALFKDGTDAGVNKHGRPQKSYDLRNTPTLPRTLPPTLLFLEQEIAK